MIAGSEVSGLYDPLIAKLIVWDRDRESARRRMLRALDEFAVEGVTTLIGFHKALLAHPCFIEGADLPRARRGRDLRAGGGAGAVLARAAGHGARRVRE